MFSWSSRYVHHNLYSGKTSIIRKINYARSPTLGAAFIVNTIQTTQGTIELSIWDTAGHDRYKNILPLYIRDKQVGIICFDVTKTNTLDCVKQFVSQWNQHHQLQLPSLIIVANNVHLRQTTDEDFINTVQGLAQAKKHKALYLEVNPKFVVSQVLYLATAIMMVQFGFKNSQYQRLLQIKINILESKFRYKTSYPQQISQLKYKWNKIIQNSTYNLQLVISYLNNINFKEQLSIFQQIRQLHAQASSKMKEISVIDFSLKFYNQQNQSEELISNTKCQKFSNIRALNEMKLKATKDFQLINEKFKKLQYQVRQMKEVICQHRAELDPIITKFKSSAQIAIKFQQDFWEKLEQQNKQDKQEEKLITNNKKIYQKTKQQKKKMQKDSKLLSQALRFIEEQLCQLKTQEQAGLYIFQQIKQLIEGKNHASSNQTSIQFLINSYIDKSAASRVQIKKQNNKNQSYEEKALKMEQKIRICGQILKQLKLQYDWESTWSHLQIMKYNRDMLQLRRGLRQKYFASKYEK